MRKNKYNPARFDKRIQILEYTKTSDGGGGYEEVLIPILNVWANIHPLHGRELYQAQQIQAQVSHKITIRYSNKVNRSHVVFFNDKYYNIQYIVNVNEANKTLELHVLERQ
ncbi:phage head closure protein [Halalkalibacter krulwichiae]|uniref:Phage head-tail joining protein n=1 Tax=Halalkalibacter krulwichiae TaxID=199441 RepID=A0A1X9M6I3_9BACI|nr:phage head closure protein [Halalkalibacter krulwichiae]ARK29048.1 Phage head-tail joining protein [Halalkalibacter krulwichiae]